MNNSNSRRPSCEVGNNSNEEDLAVNIEHLANINCHDSSLDVESLNEQLKRELKLMGENFTRLENDYQAMQIEMSNKIKELEKQLEEEQEIRKELELQTTRGKFSVETVKSNDKLFKF